jgi:transposase
MEKRVNIKFCVKLGKTPTETYEILQSVYDDEALSHSSVLVFEWFKRFKDGREDLQDDPRSGRPSTSQNSDTIVNVREMVTRDLEMMSDELNIKSSPKIYGRKKSDQSLSHTVSQMSRSSGDSYHAKTSSRLVKTIPVFLIAL